MLYLIPGVMIDLTINERLFIWETVEAYVVCVFVVIGYLIVYLTLKKLHLKFIARNINLTQEEIN
jgi:hypothetical protein